MIVASVGTALPYDLPANKALISFVCIYIFFFACSWGPGAWVVTGEIVSQQGVMVAVNPKCRKPN